MDLYLLDFFLDTLAAAGQAVGILLSPPLMAQVFIHFSFNNSNGDSGCSSCCVRIFSRGIQRDDSVWTAEVIPKTQGSGVIGTGVGMPLVMFTLRGGK